MVVLSVKVTLGFAEKSTHAAFLRVEFIACSWNFATIAAGSHSGGV